MATPRRPTSITLRSYQVGFGDCFLLTFGYGKDSGAARHVLIDFGSTKLPKNARPLLDVAKDIGRVCGKKLHAVVATHRHADHISGFAGESGRIITRLQPDVILQPWTEDPRAAKNAKAPTPALKGAHGFIGALGDMHEMAAHVLAEVALLRAQKGVSEQLRFLGEDNLQNADAVKTLMGMKGRHVYAYHGQPSGLEKVLPGVKVSVLGPPTLEQSKTITKQRARDPDEFWHFHAMAAAIGAGAAPQLFRRAARASSGALPFETRWFLPRLQVVRGDQLLEIVRILDQAMNNTSLILLFEVGQRRLLFPGDAQIENWLYALTAAPDHEAVRARLADVDLYKVGHHGSLNATPKTLWKLMKHRGAAGKKDRLRSFVSTMAGKHGAPDRGTEVPRQKLVDALEHDTDFFSTQVLTKRDEFCHVFEMTV